MPALKIEGSLDREISGITYDSRRITPGMVFVAIPGLNVDGHDYIGTALERGATAIICERNGFTAPRATKIRVSDAREALAQAASVYYQHPSTKLKVIGVTGTNGKTTVAFMIKQILETAGIKSGLIGTVRYEIGERVIPAHRTTPEALEVQQMMAQMLRAGCEACVMEVSSHAIDQKRVAGIAFDAVVFTNLTQDHLDYHGTMEAYFTAKKKLFQLLKTSPKTQAGVINIDDSFGSRLAVESNLEVKMTYGLCSAATIRGFDLKLGKDSTSISIQTPEETFRTDLALIGRHNVYNTLAAVGTATALGLKSADIARALRTLTPVPGRLEPIQHGQPFGVYVDYAHTDDALKNVLTTVREITPGKVHLVFGCGGSRDSGKRAKMGAVAAELADFTCITSDNPRRESPASIALQIEGGFLQVRPDQYEIELDRKRAIEETIKRALPGDLVLIAGKGHETYQEFEDTVVPFDDRIYAGEILECLGYFKEIED